MRIYGHVLNLAAFGRRASAGQGRDQIATIKRLITLHGEEAPKARPAVLLRNARHEHLAAPIVRTAMARSPLARQRQNREHAAWREPLPRPRLGAHYTAGDRAGRLRTGGARGPAAYAQSVEGGFIANKGRRTASSGGLGIVSYSTKVAFAVRRSARQANGIRRMSPVDRDQLCVQDPRLRPSRLRDGRGIFLTGD